MNNKEISILLVDDEERFRQGLRTLLNFYSTSASLPLNVIGEADCVEQVVKLAVQKSPDLILLD
ncbi:MAG: response regulator, partial [Nostoc sp.]